MQIVLRNVVRGIDRINWLCGWLLALLLLVMTVLISWQVFARYVMGNSLTFSEEVARFSMVWMTMLGAGYAYRYGSLISVELLADIGGRRFSKFLRLGVAVISCIFAWVLLTQGINIAERVAGQTAPSTRVSMAWLYGAMPAGAALIMLNAVAILLDAFIAKED
ncbi:TRAP transporter small permease [Pseudorhodobacter turbinis]|uniref:TRAP transporter small permease protein n=1 Tax=Pseudorhodobacter turbinis TaxID=2500533 RepID=A0A4P8EDT5_9RHOB|nr:TRAP transporter small permease [Pseudorhodobacter turbinis]QCO54996.1 TRAP transporter small permease [Pseudorhodobacter turbinis]